MLEVVIWGLVMEVDKVADDLTEMDVVGHLVGHLVHLHVGRHVSHRNVVLTLCEGRDADRMEI